MTIEKIEAQRQSIRRSLVSEKPYSRKRIRLEMQLQDLTTKALRMEGRKKRKA